MTLTNPLNAGPTLADVLAAVSLAIEDAYSEYAPGNLMPEMLADTLAKAAISAYCSTPAQPAARGVVDVIAEMRKMAEPGSDGRICNTVMMEFGVLTDWANHLESALSTSGGAEAVQGYAEIGRAFRAVLRDPAMKWRETGAQAFIDRVAQECGPTALGAYTPPPSPSADEILAIKALNKQTAYSTALQRLIECYRRGDSLPDDLREQCPHHAAMLYPRSQP